MKIYLLLALTSVLIFTSVNAYPELKTYNATYGYVTVPTKTIGNYFTVPNSPVDIEVIGTEYAIGSEIRFCKAEVSSPYFNCTEAVCSRWRNGVCIGGWYNNTYAKGYLDSNKRVTLSYPIQSYLTFQVVLNKTTQITGDSPSTHIYRLKKTSTPNTGTKINCTNGCDLSLGLVTYSIASVFSPDTCLNHILSLTNLGYCSGGFDCYNNQKVNLSTATMTCTDKYKFKYINKCYGNTTNIFTNVAFPTYYSAITPVNQGTIGKKYCNSTNKRQIWQNSSNLNYLNSSSCQFDITGNQIPKSLFNTCTVLQGYCDLLSNTYCSHVPLCQSVSYHSISSDIDSGLSGIVRWYQYRLFKGYNATLDKNKLELNKIYRAEEYQTFNFIGKTMYKRTQTKCYNITA